MRTSIVKFLFGGVLIALLYQNCTAVHQESGNLSSFQACNLILKDEFYNNYQPFLAANCAACHTIGGTGNGAFADSNQDLAFDAFLVRGNQLVGDRAKDPNHQPPYSGPQHEGTVAQLDETWNVAKQQADICVANAGIDIDNGIDEGIIPEDPVPTTGSMETFIRSLQNVPTIAENPMTLTWDLGSEIKDQVVSYPGATLSIDVQAATSSTGDKNYIFSNPVLQTGDQALHLIFIEFVINNQVVDGANSYHTVNRRVPANDSRDLGVGGTTFPYNVRSTDVVALSIGVLNGIDFAPPTHAELIAPGGVFEQYCVSCHSDNAGTGGTAAGGFDITNQANILSQLMVAPYSPNNSEIFKRMNDLQNPMPQDQGILPEGPMQQVMWWIQDGAR